VARRCRGSIVRLRPSVRAGSPPEHCAGPSARRRSRRIGCAIHAGPGRRALPAGPARWYAWPPARRCAPAPPPVRPRVPHARAPPLPLARTPSPPGPRSRWDRQGEADALHHPPPRNPARSGEGDRGGCRWIRKHPIGRVLPAPLLACGCREVRATRPPTASPEVPPVRPRRPPGGGAGRIPSTVPLASSNRSSPSSLGCWRCSSLPSCPGRSEPSHGWSAACRKRTRPWVPLRPRSSCSSWNPCRPSSPP
jgi:hypothetical protein